MGVGGGSIQVRKGLLARCDVIVMDLPQKTYPKAWKGPCL